MSRVRLMTYNVHHCTGIDGRQSPHRVAEVIAAAEPDIVALQELDVGRMRSRWVDQPRLIGKILEMEFHFFSTVRIAPGDYGTAILSRWPMRPRRSALLPVLRDRIVENRGAIWAAIDAGGRELHVVNTHLGLTRGERRLQAEALLGPEWLSHPECREPRILCGDFNMSSRREVTCFDGVCVQASWRQVGPPPRTWPSLVPLVALDHIFFSPGVVLESVERPTGLRARLASDHLPVVATFQI
jgi:endonuclease/exonuclease/phosphatase family metal-dependent hydrolase